MTAPDPRPVAPHTVVGLDGVRAIAVALVLLFHLTPGVAIGGFVGVDVFFVVSGYLITALLLREVDATGRIRLLDFWRRRARRLLPALGVLLAVCSAVALAVGGDVLVGIGRQLLGAVTFSGNWLAIGPDSDYFASSAPPLFRNLWSLAVEEQFYLLWPLLVLLLARLRMPRGARLALFLALAVASAAAMALLWTPGSSSRVYYGTDTHAFGLALGGALAVLSQRWPARALEWPRAARAALGAAGVVALGGILAGGVLLPDGSPAAFLGGLPAVAVLSAVVIAALLVPGSPLGRALSTPPLGWIGRRSYGIYLWHWPVYVLLAGALPGWLGTTGGEGALGGLALALSVGAAAISYRWIEQPVRRDGFRATARRVFLRGAAPRRIAAAAIGGLLVASAGTASAMAIVRDPGMTEAQRVVEAGRAAAASATPTPVEPSPSPTAGSGTTPTPTATGPTGSEPITGDEVTAIGDSVLLAATPELQSRLPGIEVDAAVSRQLSAAPDIVRALSASGSLRPVLVIALGTNGPIDRGTLEAIRAAAGSGHRIVVVTAQAPKPWIPEVNQTLEAFADDYRAVELADWYTAIQPQLGVLNRDRVHFGGAGARIFAGELQAALDRVAAQPPINIVRR